jgi:hypothetical protein
MAAVGARAVPIRVQRSTASYAKDRPHNGQLNEIVLENSCNKLQASKHEKFAPEKIELRNQTASQLGQLLRELRKDRGSYFGHLTYHLLSRSFTRAVGFTSGQGLR